MSLSSSQWNTAPPPAMQDTPPKVKPKPNKMKRTSFSPWNSGTIGSRSSSSAAVTGANKARAAAAAAAATTTTSAPAPAMQKVEPVSPEPLRIVSDILAPPTAAAGQANTAGGGELSAHPKIVALQSQWETKQKAAGEEGAKIKIKTRSPSAITPANIKGVKRSLVDAFLKHQSKKKARSDGVSSAGSASSATPPPRYLSRPASISRPKFSKPASVSEPASVSKAASVSKPTPVSKPSPAPADGNSSSGSATPSRPPNASQSTGRLGSLRPEARSEARAVANAAVEREMEKIKAAQEVQKQVKEDGLMGATDFLKGIDKGTHDMDREKKSMPPKTKLHPWALDGPNKGQAVVAIPMAEPGRHYSAYRDAAGQLSPGRGALFPAHHKLAADSHPFICPVRHCRRMFTNIGSMGGHFSAAHSAQCFNDNGDGTFTSLCKYAMPTGSRSAPAIVISQDPLPANAPPAAEPNLPPGEYVKQDRAVVGSSSNGLAQTGALRSQTSTHVPPPALPVPLAPSPRTCLPSDRPAVKDYLHKFLIPTQKTFKREDVRQMLRLPRLRVFPEPWLRSHSGSELDATLYTCALAYLVGEEVTGEKACKARTWQGHSARLSGICIKLPLMQQGARGRFSMTPTCVGCRYWSYRSGEGNRCDWAPAATVADKAETDSPATTTQARDSKTGSGTESVKALGVNPQGTKQNSPASRPTDEAASDLARSTDDYDDDDDVIGPRRTSRRVVAPASYSLKRVKESLPKIDSTTTSDVAEPTDRSESVGTPRTAEAIQPPVKEESTLISTLEMEDWEVAPGRMTDTSSQNIAFSNSYLTSGQPVTISGDVKFNVQTIKPGASANWSAGRDELRTVSVASGKIRVTMNDKTFNLGPNGVFVIRSGKRCKVENRLYIDSVVHCTTITDV